MPGEAQRGPEVLRRVIDRSAQDRWKDWGLLDGCFGATRITPSDVDGIVERNGEFLILEGKLGGAVSYGQRRMYENLSRRLECPLLYLWGQPNDIRRWEVWNKGKLQYKGDTSNERVRDYVRRWFNYVNRGTDS